MLQEDTSRDDGYQTERQSFSSEINSDCHILIVDDQSFNIDALKIIMKYHLGIDSGKYCTGALSGEQALEIIQKDIVSQTMDPPRSKFSLIFMDCNMPGMDGFETTLKIREYLHAKGA